METVHSHLGKVCLAGVLLSAFSSLARCDYNVAIFLFAYFIHKKAVWISTERKVYATNHAHSVHHSGYTIRNVLVASMGN